MLLWKLHSLDDRFASIRYRALLPAQVLSSYKYRSVIGKSLTVEQLRQAEAAIFIRPFSMKDLAFAQKAHDLGVPVVVDICDNISEYTRHQAEIIQAMSRHADMITTTGTALVSALRDTLEVPVPIMVVSDGIETGNTLRIGQRLIRRAYFDEVLLPMLMSESFWMRVIPKIWGRVFARMVSWKRHVLQRISRAWSARKTAGSHVNAIGSILVGSKGCSFKTVIWFGRSGGAAGKYGILDIVDIAPYLEQLAKRVRFKLVVVSNDRDAYEKLVRPLPIETRYAEWDNKSSRRLIKASDVAIVPNSGDAIAICKSANRAVLALSLGVPVVASRTPAMEVLKGCVCFDDWVEGLYRYLTEPELVRDHIRTAQRVLEREFGPDRIASQWLDVLERIKAPISHPSTLTRSIPVVILSEQQIDLAVQFLTQAGCWEEMRCIAWVPIELLETTPHAWTCLQESGVEIRVFDDENNAEFAFHGIDAVVTFEQTDHSLDQFVRHILREADEKGIRTYTIPDNGAEMHGVAIPEVLRKIAKDLGVGLNCEEREVAPLETSG